jgi:hypothetical protein
MGVLTQLSICSFSSSSSEFNNLQMHNEGVYILFPSCALKQSTLELNSIYFTLTTLNVVYLLKDESLKAQGPDYNIQVRFIKFQHQCSRNDSKVFSKFVLALVQLSSASTLDRLMCW